jgi:hypothetical protein
VLNVLVPVPFTNKKRLIFEGTLPINPPVSGPRKPRTKTVQMSSLLAEHTLHSPSPTASAGKESEEKCTPATTTKAKKDKKRSQG